MKTEVTKLFNLFADNAESYGAENLYLARRDEGYVGDPKEFRFGEIYARRIPTYKYELISDYINEASKLPHQSIGRRLTSAEADWMRRQAKKMYEDERSYAPQPEKTAKQLDTEIAEALAKKEAAMTPAEIWKKLTPSQRVTLLDDANVGIGQAPTEVAIAAGIQQRGHITRAYPSGAARHALGRRGLSGIGTVWPIDKSAAGFHTPRELTPLGREVVDYALTLLRGAHATKKVSMPKKKVPQPPVPNPIDTIRRIMRSSGFDEEEAYGQKTDELLFSSREDGDIAEGHADPGTVRFAREKAKEVEAAVPGAKARVETVDEWVSISVSLPPGSAPRVATPEPAPLPRATAAQTSSRQRASFKPGDKIKYTNFTIGSSYEGNAIVTWDHGKSIEARTLYGGEKIRIERAADGSLRRFT